MRPKEKEYYLPMCSADFAYNVADMIKYVHGHLIVIVLFNNVSIGFAIIMHYTIYTS